jgi:hypothetical protein
VSESAKTILLALAVVVAVLVSLVVSLIACLLAVQEGTGWSKVLTRAGMAFGGAMGIMTGFLALVVGLYG